MGNHDVENQLIEIKIQKRKKVEESGGEGRRNKDNIKLVQQPPYEMN